MQGEVILCLQPGFVDNFAAELSREPVGESGHGRSRDFHFTPFIAAETLAPVGVNRRGKLWTVPGQYQRINREFFARMTYFQIKSFSEERLQHEPPLLR